MPPVREYASSLMYKWWHDKKKKILPDIYRFFTNHRTPAVRTAKNASFLRVVFGLLPILHFLKQIHGKKSYFRGFQNIDHLIGFHSCESTDKFLHTLPT